MLPYRKQTLGLGADQYLPWESLRAVPTGGGDTSRGATKSAFAPGYVLPCVPLENVGIHKRNGPGFLLFQGRRGMLLMLFA